MTDIEVPGPEIDNLLGFLCLLGALRALDASRRHWFARLYFAGVPLRARLVLDVDAARREIVAAVSEGLEIFRPYFRFQEQDLTFSAEAARGYLRDARNQGDIPAMVFSALCSDGAFRADGARILPTPLCAMFGQGHQHFLQRLTNVANGAPPRSAKTTAADLNDLSRIDQALFGRWTRRDATEAFRWDFEEDRRYALRYTNPSNDPAMTEHGANRLAVVGMLSFQTAPILRGPYTQLAARGVSRGQRSEMYITWPIWTMPATLETIHSMLDRRELTEEIPDLRAFKYAGVIQARRVRRMHVEKFISFSRAKVFVLKDSGSTN
jgi:hypothetical protein